MNKALYAASLSLGLFYIPFYAFAQHESHEIGTIEVRERPVPERAPEKAAPGVSNGGNSGRSNDRARPDAATSPASGPTAPKAGTKSVSTAATATAQAIISSIATAGYTFNQAQTNEIVRQLRDERAKALMDGRRADAKFFERESNRIYASSSQGKKEAAERAKKAQFTEHGPHH